ncbi:MAG: HD-GYP domain-containing protein [Lachnospiraceae bacterium]|nr:HD-GYP domain-containing protein [Lachnospiraceae bacterium]
MEKTHKNDILMVKVTNLICAAGIIMLILSRIFGFYYAFDEQNRYYRLTDSYWIMIVLIQAILVSLIVYTIFRWKAFSLLEKVSYLMFESLPVVAVIIQLFHYGISLTTFAVTVSVYMIFISYSIDHSRKVLDREHESLNQVIYALAQTIDAKDTYTNGHSTRVAKYSKMLAMKMDLSKEQVDKIYRMALLHDVGKIGVDDAIIRKPDKLTDEEYAEIKTHTVKGDEILSKITFMPELKIGARYHHERYDGKGYPDGLSAEEIPFEARVIAVADSYDAMTSNRSYRKYLPQDVVRSEIEKNAGTQFDPEITPYMLMIIDEDNEYVLHE